MSKRAKSVQTREIAVHVCGADDGGSLMFRVGPRVSCGDITNGVAVRWNTRSFGFVADANDLLRAVREIAKWRAEKAKPRKARRKP